MQRSILCLTDRESANRMTQLLAQQKIPTRVIAKSLGLESFYVLESERSHESEILKLAQAGSEQLSLLGCPSCRSPRIDHPPVPDESATLRFLASLMSGFGESGSASFYCRSCHYHWFTELESLARAS